MFIIETLAHLDGDRKLPRVVNNSLNNASKELALVRQCRPATLARDLGNGATKIEVNVIGQVFIANHRRRARQRIGVNAIELE